MCYLVAKDRDAHGLLCTENNSWKTSGRIKRNLIGQLDIREYSL